MSGSIESSGAYVQSVERALQVILAFDEQHPSMTLADVARRTGLNRAAARRFLHTLATLGYVRVDERQFSLTPRVLRLGFAYLSSLLLPELAEPHLKDLSRVVGESTSASVLDGDDVVYVARAATQHRVMSLRIAVGTRFPAYATSMGHVLLAGLPSASLHAVVDQIRFEPLTPHTIRSGAQLQSVLDHVKEQGYAVVDQELELGLRSVAAPIRGRDGQVVAAINVSTAVRPGQSDPIPGIIPHLLTYAQRISADLIAQS